MLIWMREGAGGKAMKILLLTLMTMAVGGLVLMDVGGFFKSDISAGTIVKGGGVNISTQEFDRSVRRALSSQGIQPEEALQLGMIKQILQGEVQAQLFEQKTHELGLLVGDEDVKLQIAKLAAPIAANGQSKKAALQQLLRNQGLSEGEFISMVRQEMATGLLRSALQPPAALTSPIIADSLYRYDNEKRTAQGIVLKNAGVTDFTAPTEENLRKYYEANKQDFIIPGSRTITVASLKPAMLAKNVKVTDEEVRADYDKNIAAFTTPGTRSVEQAIVKTEAEAQKVVAAIKEGKSLKDSAPADTYVAARDYEAATMLRELSPDVFAAKKDDVVGPLQSAVGWHVLVVKDIQPETVTSFAEAKDKLKEELEQSAASDGMVEAGNTIEDRVAAGDALEDLVTEYGMTTEIIGPFRVGGTDKSGNDAFKAFGADRDKFLQAAGDYQEGEIAPLIETADGQFHLVRVDQVIADSYRDYSSVKGELTSRWTGEQKRLSNQARAKKARESLDAGKSLAAVATESGVSVQTFAGINRKDAPPAPLNPVVAAQVFTTEKSKAFSSEIEDGFVVGVVTDITMPNASAANQKEKTDLTDLVGRTLAQDIVSQYADHLTDDKVIKINQRQIDLMYGPKPGAQ